jgi:hypothetical protein
MRHIDRFVVGWLDFGIRYLVQNNWEILRDTSFVLVTDIDSMRDPARLAPKIRQEYPACRILDDGILMPGNILSAAHESIGLFFGFDEMWLFDHEPTEGMPKDVSLVGPYNIETDEIRPAIKSWMDRSQCKLGLGDGTGLNYVTPDKEIASAIEFASTHME